MDAVDSEINYRKSSQNTIEFYLGGLKLHETYSFQRVCEKDSRDLTDKDRDDFIKAIQKCDSVRVLVIHGTYTMPDTARYFQKHKDKIKSKTVVLTGSMTPLEGFWWTDAPFNLGFSVSTLMREKPGIYVAMNGKVFSPNDVKKNVKEMRFESIK